MSSRIFKSILLTLLWALQLTVHAEDIDLFAGASAGPGTAPNLLLVFDNAANFSSDASGNTCIIDAVPTALSGKVGGIEQCALHTAISGLAVGTTATVNVGVMMYKGSNVVNYLNVPCTGGNGGGGCLVYPLTPLTLTSRPVLLNWIKSWTTSGSGPGYVKANNEATGAAMQEAWAYLAGKTGLSGTDYASIAPAAGCLKNFVTFIGNSFGPAGTPGDSGAPGPKGALEGTSPVAGMNAVGATADMFIPIPSTAVDQSTSCEDNKGVRKTFDTPVGDPQHERGGLYADEWARYMLSRAITTYTIGVIDKATCNESYAWLLSSMATSGGGKYFEATNKVVLKLAFDTILSEVQSVNTVFAAVSLPVSVSTQGTYLNQVFMGMFRPDGDSLPRWAGNLKQYKMGFVNGALRLQDADSSPAVSSSGSNFIAECGRSFWTPGLGNRDSYWNLNQTANCAGYSAASNTPDGNLVEKGGQGYMLRSMTPSARVMKTCSSVFNSCTSLTDFDTSNTGITDLLLGSSGTSDSSTTVSRATLINWARGQNTKTVPSNDEKATVLTTAMRPSAHSDVVHSRPVAVNFGTDAAPQIVVFYGGNDGVLRAINGNRPDKSTPSIGTFSPGAEMWSFVPPEFYGKFKRLYDNSDKLIVPNLIAGTPTDYGMDGTVTAYSVSKTEAWVYATMRRGGRAIYAFKVTLNGGTFVVDLKWKRGCGDSGTTNCSSIDLNTIGQTWATPKFIKSTGYSGGGKAMLAMGGGYDATCEDASNYACTSIIGNRIYVMDADSGSLLKSFSTDRPVVGDLTFVRNSAGMATFGYAADLGGNLYRISGNTANTAIGANGPADWTITKIASLGCATTVVCSSPPNRKFIYGPDVVVDGVNNILLLGSGDREKPLNTSNQTNNYFFMIKDVPTDALATIVTLDSLYPVTIGTVPASSALAAKNGWYMALQRSEQVVTSTVTVYGVSYFSTHQPTTPVPGSCSANLGTTRSYGVAYATAADPSGTSTPPFTTLTSGGLPPSPVAGKVILDDGSIVPFIIGVKGPLESKELPPPAGSTNRANVRSYWSLTK